MEDISFTISTMDKHDRLQRAFFDRNALVVARELLGMRLVRFENGSRIAGLIIETEAYRGKEDLGCHCRHGITPRTQVMFGTPGHAYVYFTYGMHWMLNFVVEETGYPAAVLIRAIFPVEGLKIIQQRRGKQTRLNWVNGPAKICQALNIDKSMNGADICEPEAVLFVEKGINIPEASVTQTPRVGLYTVPEPWKSIPWRFVVDSSLDIEKMIEIRSGDGKVI